MIITLSNSLNFFKKRKMIETRQSHYTIAHIAWSNCV